jgi:hypothetical protein
MDKDERFPRIDLIDFCQRYAKNFTNAIHLTLDHIDYTSGNISYFELIAITTLIRQFTPTSIIEFGTFNGRTTLNMACNSRCNETQIYTVDLPVGNIIETKFPMADGVHDKNNELGYVGLKEKLFNNYPITICPVHQLWMDTATININIFRDKFDFMFIDASHSYENCLNDSNIGHELVKDGGIILWHDYNGWPGVTKALHEFYESHHWMTFYWFHDTSIVVAQNIKQRG